MVLFTINIGRMFSWERDKYGVLGNRSLPSGIEFEYNRDWNVFYLIQVDPLNTKYTFTQTAWHCLEDYNAEGCSTENIPTYV
jgi:hypothetical protein